MASTPLELISRQLNNLRKNRFEAGERDDLTTTLAILWDIVSELTCLENQLPAGAQDNSRDDFRCNNGHNFQSFSGPDFARIQTPINPTYPVMFCTKCGAVRPLVSHTSYANKEK